MTTERSSTGRTKKLRGKITLGRPLFIGRCGSSCKLDTVQLPSCNSRPQTGQEKGPHAHRVGGCIEESSALQSSPERTFTPCS